MFVATWLSIQQIQAMTQLSLFAESLALLVEILNGAKLPQACSEYSRPLDQHGVRREMFGI